jgi:hypothetical protein
VLKKGGREFSAGGKYFSNVVYWNDFSKSLTGYVDTHNAK